MALINMKFTEHKSFVLAVASYFLASGLVIATLIFFSSPWWCLLAFPLWCSFRAKYTAHVTCPKCGHVFESDGGIEDGS